MGYLTIKISYQIYILLNLLMFTLQDYQPFSIRSKGGYLSWRKQRQDSFKLVCYMTNWAQYRPGETKFSPSNIDPFLCTHLIFAFAAINNSTYDIKSFEWNDESKFDEEERFIGRYEELNNLKQINPSLKTLLAIGGWTMGSAPFSEMTRNDTLRARFIRSAVKLLRKYKFDGLDLDWEFPAKREGSRPEDRHSFSLFVRDLREAFYNEAMATRQEQLLLSAAVAAEKYTILKAYDIPSIVPHLDFISIMSYDYHGSWDKKLGHNSPLYSSYADNDEDKRLTIDWTVRLYLTLGVPPEKLIIGLAYYGRSFTTPSKSERSFGQQSVGDGKPGESTREAGFLSYGLEICRYIKKENWTREWSKERQVPIAYKANQWVGYDDEESVRIKTKYAVKHCLGGAMIWSIDLDDFRATCSEKPFPLTRVVQLTLKEMNRKACAYLPKIEDYDVKEYSAMVTKWTDSPIEFTDFEIEEETTKKAITTKASKSKSSSSTALTPFSPPMSFYKLSFKTAQTAKSPPSGSKQFKQTPENLNNILIAIQNSNLVNHKTDNVLDKVLLQYLVNITKPSPVSAVNRNFLKNSNANSMHHRLKYQHDSQQPTESSAEATTIVALASDVDNKIGNLSLVSSNRNQHFKFILNLKKQQPSKEKKENSIEQQQQRQQQWSPQPQHSVVTSASVLKQKIILNTIEPNMFVEEKYLPKKINQGCDNLPDGEFVRDPTDCGAFYTCFMGRLTKKQTCNQGLAFDKKLKVCNWKSEVNCLEL